tara:strand:- start:661 stop:852 length:192 start_codon:yes stop_codon:yes gene_type:complete
VRIGDYIHTIFMAILTDLRFSLKNSLRKAPNLKSIQKMTAGLKFVMNKKIVLYIILFFEDIYA